MKFIKAIALLIAIIAVATALGWVVAINALKSWAEQYVAVSSLDSGVIPMAIAAHVLIVKGKAMTAPSVSRPNYAAMTIRELKALAKGTGIKAWDRLRKAELVAALANV